jgi:flagellar basal body-associated protein FliL
MDGKDGKNKLMLMIIILLLVVTMGTIGGVSWYALNRLNQPPEDFVPEVPQVPELRLDELSVFTIGNITRNLRNPNPTTTRGHVMVINVSLQIDSSRDTDDALLELLETHIDLVRDIINSIVGNYTFEELNQPMAEDILREEILVRVSEEFQTSLIVRVNFANWQIGSI